VRTELRERKLKLTTDVISTALGEEEMAVSLYSTRDEQPYGGSNVACTPVARQRPRNKQLDNANSNRGAVFSARCVAIATHATIQCVMPPHGNN
jgi:hypothetical protein